MLHNYYQIFFIKGKTKRKIFFDCLKQFATFFFQYDDKVFAQGPNVGKIQFSLCFYVWFSLFFFTNFFYSIDNTKHLSTELLNKLFRQSHQIHVLLVRIRNNETWFFFSRYYTIRESRCGYKLEIIMWINSGYSIWNRSKITYALRILWPFKN